MQSGCKPLERFGNFNAVVAGMPCGIRRLVVTHDAMAMVFEVKGDVGAHLAKANNADVQAHRLPSFVVRFSSAFTDNVSKHISKTCTV